MGLRMHSMWKLVLTSLSDPRHSSLGSRLSVKKLPKKSDSSKPAKDLIRELGA